MKKRGVCKFDDLKIQTICEYYSFNHPTDQSTNPPFKKSTNQLINRSTDHQIK